MSKRLVRKKLSGGITIRINHADRLKLDKISKLMGLAPSTLARVWIIEKLMHSSKLLKFSNE